MKRSTKVWMVFMAAFGLFMLVHGLEAHRQGREWASMGGHKSGPMTPVTEMVAGALFLLGAGWAIFSSKKKEED